MEKNWHSACLTRLTQVYPKSNGKELAQRMSKVSRLSRPADRQVFQSRRLCILQGRLLQVSSITVKSLSFYFMQCNFNNFMKNVFAAHFDLYYFC